MNVTQKEQEESNVYEFVKRSKQIMRKIIKEKGFTAKEAKETMGLRVE
jgi:hypothetical protein